MIAVIIPTYCEADNIKELITRLESLDLDLWLTVIDDSSPDGTGEIVKELSETYSNIKLIERDRKMGIGAAILSGLEYLSSRMGEVEYVAVMDADLSHDPSDLPRLLEAVKGCDVVVGSRYVDGGSTEGWSLGRELMSKVANKMANLLLGLGIGDATSGYRVYRLESVLKIMDLIENFGFPFQIESLYHLSRVGSVMREEPISFRDRTGGSTKLNLGEILSFISLLFRLKFRELRSHWMGGET